MDFKFDNKQVRSLFSYSNKQLCIPRYQRDYSWKKKEIDEFFKDILSGIEVNNTKVTNTEYFLGTILLAGDFNDHIKEIDVIDGQQRITTITIFLSVLASKFHKIEKQNLGNKIWKYIINTDDDDEEFKVISNDTNNAYFEYLVQTKDSTDKEPIDEEQDKLKFAYDYFSTNLEEDKLRNILDASKFTDFSCIIYEDILKAIREQILNSNIICLTTKDKKSVNSIFEILNAKGKKLESIDLIKNSIFSYLDMQVPTDDAQNIWKQIKNNLVSREIRIELTTFYRQYWISKYKKVKEDELYKEFTSNIKQDHYQDFLVELEQQSSLYVKLIRPYPSDYNDRKEKLYIVECLKYFNEYFNIKQIRVALLALFNLHLGNGLLTNKMLRETLFYLHGFHFAYNALCSKRSNTLEAKYSKFSIELNKADTKNKVDTIISTFINQLNEIYPTYNEFEREFIQLSYTKMKSSKNMISKYVMNNIEKYLADVDVAPQHGTIEHILPESKDNDVTKNIGNLILLEEKLNEEAGNKDFNEKKLVFEKSTYKSVMRFINEYNSLESWDKTNILNRAKAISKLYYTEILERTI